MLNEKSQLTQNGTMFVDLDRLLNASCRLSASAELLVIIIIDSFCLPSPWQFRGLWPNHMCLSSALIQPVLEQFLHASFCIRSTACSIGSCQHMRPMQWSSSFGTEVGNLSWVVGWRLTVSILLASTDSHTSIQISCSLFSIISHENSAVRQQCSSDLIFQRWWFTFLIVNLPVVLIITASQYSFHLWHTSSNSMSFLPALATVLTIWKMSPLLPCFTFSSSSVHIDSSSACFSLWSILLHLTSESFVFIWGLCLCVMIPNFSCKRCHWEPILAFVAVLL